MAQTDAGKDPTEQSVTEKSDSSDTAADVRANADAETEAPEPTTKQPKVIPQQSGHKKKPLVWILLILIILAGVAYWWLVVRKSKSPTTSTNSQQAQTQSVINTNTPMNVAYAFKGTDSGPYTLYWRPASGGDRTAVNLKLDTSETIIGSDVNGSEAVVATSKAIDVSTDEGKTYKTVVTLSPNEQITSIKLATDGQTIVYGDLPDAGGKNTVKYMKLDGSGSKTLFVSDQAGVFILAYSSEKQKIVYREGCFGCDGAAGLPIIRDLKTNKTTDLIAGLSTNDLVSVTVSSDISTLVYAQATENSDAPEQALGVFTGAPYTINTIDLSRNKASKVTSFGTKDEKNTNGTLKSRQVHVGFVSGTNTPYYTNDNQLFTVKGSSTMVYQATKLLLVIPFVGPDNVIAGSGDQTADYTLANYNISTKQSTTIFSGDNNTILFGVTTK